MGGGDNKPQHIPDTIPPSVRRKTTSWVSARCLKKPEKRIYHSLSLLSILQHALGGGLVQGPTFNFMLLKQEKGHRTKEVRLMPRAGPLAAPRAGRQGAPEHTPACAVSERPASLMKCSCSSRSDPIKNSLMPCHRDSRSSQQLTSRLASINP